MKKKAVSIILVIMMIMTMAPVMTVYGTDNTSAPLTVELESYNGDMKFSFGEDSADITSGLKKFEMGDSADLNEVLESNNMTKFSIEYWTDRELLGWNVLETDDASVEEPDWQYVMKQNDAGNMEELMISTEEMLNYQFGSKSLRFEAVWAGNDSYYYSEVRLYDYDCNTGVYWGDDETNVSYWSDSSYMLKDPRHLKDTDSYGNPVNRKIVEQEEAAELQNLVVHGEYVGWIKFDKAQNGDGEEPGYEYNDFDSEGNEKYYTTSEVLNSNVPEDDVLFVVVRANENIGVGTYIDNINEMINGNWSSGNGGGENNDPRIEVEGNGGTFTVTIAGETSDPQEQKAFFLSEDHQTIGDCLGDAEISTPNYWTDREFSGWIAYKKYADYDEEGNEISSWREPLYEEPLPLSEALKYSINPNNVYYLVAEWGGMESDYYSYMSVDPYYGSFDVYHGDEITEENKEIVDYPWRDSLAVKKDGVSTFDDMCGFIIGSASKDGATFEGWLKFIRSYNEEEGWNIDLVTDDNSEPTIYEGNDLLNCTGDAGDVIYVAKYAENTDIIDYINYVNEEYLWNDGGEGDGENDDPRIEFEGNGGTFTVTVNSEETFDEVQGHEFPLSEDHQTIGDCLGYATISEVPDYWTERPFLGWNIYKRIEYNEDGESWTERDCLTDKPVTMEQVLRFEIDPNGIYYVSAEWEGRESDYYSSLYVHANGGNVTITRHESEGDTFTTSDWETDRIRNDGETRFDEANVSIGDANKEGAEFEGWLEFRRAYVEVDGFEMQQVNLVTEVDADGNITFTDPKDMLDRTAAGGDLIYIAKYSDTTLEDCIQFANDCYIWDDAGEGDGDWGDEGDEDYVPEDTILVEYWSYNETGEYEFTALARYIDGVSTYRDLLESMEAEVQHYEGMSTPSYEYNGGFNSNMDMYWDGVDLDSPAVGGLRLNAVPTYDEWLLKTDVIYYGADNEAQTDTQYIVVDKVIDNGDGTNRPSTYNDVIKLATIPEADDHSQDLGFKNEWEYSVTEGQMLNNWVDVSNLDAAISVDDPYYNNMLRVVAKYEKYDLTFTYNYLDKDGNVKTVSEDKLVPADYSISSYFTGLELNDSYQAVDEEDDVQDIKWQIHPWWGFTDEPTVDLPEIIASAQYADKTPVYVGIELVADNKKLFDGRQYDIENVDKVVYVDGVPEAETAGDEDGEEYCFTESFEQKVCSAVKAADTESTKDFELQYYSVYTADGAPQEMIHEDHPEFLSGIRMAMMPVYDKALVLTQYPGEKVKEEVVDNGSWYEMPEVVGNHTPVWDVACAFRGGRTEIGYFSFDVESPYMSVRSVYSVILDELKSVPADLGMTVDEVKEDMQEAVMGENGFGSEEFADKDFDVEFSFYDASLQYRDDEAGEWKDASHEQFPEQGLGLYLPYPEGTSWETHDFFFVHYITSGDGKGNIEVFEPWGNKNGISANVYSLSPVGIAYTEKLDVGEMSDTFKSYLNEEGKLVINSVPPTNDTEFSMIAEYYLWLNSDEEYNIGIDTLAAYPHDYDRVYVTLTKNSMDGPEFDEEEAHIVDVIYEYDEEIQTAAAEYIKNLPKSSPQRPYEFWIDDMELMNYWVNGSEETEGDDQLINYSTEFKELTDYANFSMVISSRYGSGDAFFTECGGLAWMVADDHAYFFADYGAAAKHTIYVPDGTKDDAESLRAAVQKRVDEYAGEDVVNISIDEMSAQERFDTCLDEIREYWENDSEVWDESVQQMYDWDVERFINANEYILDSAGGHVFVAEVNRPDGEIATYRFGVQIDSDGMKNPVFKSKDLITGVEVSSPSAEVPLDSLIEAEKKDECNDYLKEEKNIEDHVTYDLKVYSKTLAHAQSNSKNGYITQLDNGQFEVVVPVKDKSWEGKTIVAYYVYTDGPGNSGNEMIEEHEVTVNDGYAVFYTDHFSEYTLAEVAEGVPEEPTKNGIVDGVYYENSKPIAYKGLVYQDGYFYYVNDGGKVIKDRDYFVKTTNDLTFEDGTKVSSKMYHFDEDGKMVVESNIIKAILAKLKN